MSAGGRPCTICTHAERAEIDRAIIGGGNLVEVSKRFDCSSQALLRHRDKHIPTDAMQAGAQSVAASEAGHGTSMAQQAAALHARAMSLLAKAEAAGDLRTALAGVREAARCIELLAKLSGDLDASTTLNLTVAPAFITVQAAILTALDPFPDARRAVVQALGAVA